ncbi:MAG: hypothetical protein IT379_15415 [Deltaproteobacteria bacterium]|nr:hypothetical protein [Deltaproteobacteria bacterium]
MGVTTAEPADERPERPSRAPRRKSALPPPVRRSEPPLSSRPPDSRIAIPATERAVRVSDRPLRTSEPPRIATEAPPTRASEPPRHSDRPARLSSVPPLDDGGLSLDLGEIGPAEGTRVSQSDLPAETTHASVIAAALDQATDPGSVLPPRARASDVPPPMGGDPFASRTSTPGSVAPPPLADLFGDADDVLFGPDASRPLSVAAPPLTPPPSEPVRGSLEVDLDDLDSELDSFIEDDGDVTASPLQPTRHAGFTALDTVMADPFDAEEQEPTTIGSVASLGLGGNDEVEPTLVASVDQFEELGLGLSGAPQPSAAPQAPSSAPPLGGLRATSAPPPADAPRQKGFLKKLFGGK